MQLPMPLRIFAAVCLALALFACDRADTSSYITSAKSYLGKSDYGAAIIQLKNALVKSPNSGEARFLLATSLLEMGDPVGAETEARKALDLKYLPDESNTLIARALLRQGAYRRVVSEFGGTSMESAGARADLGTSLAIAYLNLGDQKEARSAINNALAANPKSVSARVVHARLTARENNMPQAQKIVDEVLAEKPGDIDAALLKSEMQLAQGKRDDAIATLERAIEATPGDIRPRSVVIPLLVQAKQLDRAAAQLEGLKKAAPGHILTFYSDALVSAARGDQAHAKDAILQALKIAPEHLPSIYLAGLISYQTGATAAAEDAMRKVIARAPNEINARQLLASIYLRSGRPVQALEVLEPALRRVPNNPRLLRTAGEAYLASNDPVKATEYFEKANELDKGNVAGQVELAQVRLATGDTERALRDLDALAKTDASSNVADLALVSAYMRRNEYDKALGAVSALEKKQPASAVPYSLRGTVYLAKGDTKAARAGFNKAMEVDPAFFNAAYNLTRLDLAERNFDAASKRYSAMLAKDPNNETLLLAQAELLATTGAPQGEVTAVLERAIAANPTSPRPRLSLIAFLVQKRDTKAALVAAQAAQAALPDDPAILSAVGSIQGVNGSTAQAVETFKHLVRAQPQNAAALLKLAEAQLVAKDYDGAIESLRQALAIQPDLPEAWAAMAAAYVSAGRPESAIAEGRKYQTDNPDRAIGYAIEGDAFVLRKEWPEAAAAFGKALSRQPLPAIAIRRYNALQNAGKQAEATAMADKWFKDHPKEVALRAFVAQQNLRKKDYPAAIRQYEAALEIAPNNALYLNNLAWVLNEVGDPRARKYAEQVYVLTPTNPTVLDTLGWILVQHGDAARGLDLLKTAVRVDPSENDIRMHLAKALLKTGDKAGAKTELQALAKLDQASEVRDEAQKMLKEL
jgi:putative PEP-CTERM system TPR-repeat lipoprotein